MSKDGVRLSTGVRHEKVEPAVAVVVAGRDAHSGVRIVDSLRGATLLEAEAEPFGVSGGPTGPGNVLVELIRVFVVGDVQVGPPVSVVVREQRAEAVAELSRLEPRLDPDFAEPRVSMLVVAFVEVEQVAHTPVVRGEAADRVRHRSVEIRVAGDEQIGAAVAVDVGHRSARVPAEGVDPGGRRTFGERAVAVVPEQLVVGRRRDQEVGVAVSVEVRRHAALPADCEVRTRLLADVEERAPDVVEERAARQPTVLLPTTSIRVGERVDDEQVEPAVAVVVEPADTPSHHRGQVVGDAEAEGAVAEVEPDLRRDVLEPDIGERACRADERGMRQQAAPVVGAVAPPTPTMT